jgi:hypothetical protein
MIGSRFGFHLGKREAPIMASQFKCLLADPDTFASRENPSDGSESIDAHQAEKPLDCGGLPPLSEAELAPRQTNDCRPITFGGSKLPSGKLERAPAVQSLRRPIATTIA